MDNVRTNIEVLKDALDDQKVLDFVVKLRLKNYEYCTSRQRKSIKSMISKCLRKLVTTIEENPDKMDSIMDETVKRVFRKDSPNFWFNELESNYRNNIKVDMEFRDIKKYILGKNILDVGCGHGKLSVKLVENGYNCRLTDVVDYRSEEAQNIPFKKSTSPLDIPFRDNCADTALVFVVLHHINSEHLTYFLEQIKRKAKRIIIKEDIFGIHIQSKGKNIRNTFTSKFYNFTNEEQRKIITLSDYISNVFLQGITNINFPFTFKTIETWEGIFHAHGFRVVKTYIKGLKKDYVKNTYPYYGSFHVYFILDVV